MEEGSGTGDGEREEVKAGEEKEAVGEGREEAGVEKEVAGEEREEDGEEKEVVGVALAVSFP